MPLRIQLAETEDLLEQVFRLRHDVFCQEKNLIQARADQVVVDQFDTFPASRIFVALDDADQVIGSVRVTLDNAVGLPADEYFDFRAHVPDDSRCMSVNMYCIAQAHRSAIVASGLMLMCGYCAMDNEIDYVFMPLNPTIKNLIRRIGARPVIDGAQTVPHLNVGFVPFLLKLSEMNDAFMHFATQNVTHNMIGSYQCAIFKKGEPILRKGEALTSAYLIIDGTAQIEELSARASFGAGDLVGADALITETAECEAEVVATSLVRAMVLPKVPLLAHLRSSPQARAAVMHRSGLQLV